jgi:hypothetical protein
MGRYVVLYNAPESAREMMADADPEQVRAGMEAWMVWAQKAGDAVVDLGQPLQAAARVQASGTSPSSSQASGYSILQADSNEEVETLLHGHPHLNMPESSIDIFEVLPLPGT